MIARAAEVFARIGFNACSVDDLVEVTALHRGSLYKAFGSKRGLFEKVLDQVLVGEWYREPAALDLLISPCANSRQRICRSLPVAATPCKLMEKALPNCSARVCSITCPVTIPTRSSDAST
ncbi:TetR/AcrR family transcriptional regulator [Cupriavidus taiwanensis]|uniref:TetR/AcrR family transcriptional regulator n=1 Tax=Cupriavidus taiwanensis TaxID=164546 RepID=UPI001E429E3A|nr:helix-turn-helix domain-containing protein [Cupriavidus taiwanensis]